MSAQLLFLAIGTVLASRPEACAHFFRVLLICAGVLALYGLLQSLGFDGLPAAVPFRQAGRITATFENPNFFGNLLACALPVATAFFLLGATRKSSLLLLACNALLYTGVLLSGSRGAWWAALSGTALSATGLIWHGPTRSTHIKRAALLAALFTLLTLGFSGHIVIKQANQQIAVGRRLLSSSQVFSPQAPDTPEISQHSLAHRWWIWRVSWRLIRQNPLLGHGLGQFGPAFAAQRRAMPGAPADFEDVAFAHNELLHIAAESGLPALLGFLALLLGLLAPAVHHLTTRTAPATHWALLGLSAAMLVHSLISYPLHLPLNTMIFWLTLGLLTSPREAG